MKRAEVTDADLLTGFCTVQPAGGPEIPETKFLVRPPRVGQLVWLEEVAAGVHVAWPEGAAGSGEALVPFVQNSVSAGASNALVPFSGAGTEVTMPRDGCITSRSVRMGIARAAGSLTVEITVNGSQVSALDATINASSVLQVVDNYDFGLYAFARGDEIAARYDSTAGFSPVGLGQAINAVLGVILE